MKLKPRKGKDQTVATSWLTGMPGYIPGAPEGSKRGLVANGVGSVASSHRDTPTRKPLFLSTREYGSVLSKCRREACFNPKRITVDLFFVNIRGGGPASSKP